jgi:hypothetical protein
MIRRAAFVLVLLALGGCREQREDEVQPIALTGTPRAPVAEEPSPLIVQPHLRRVERGDQPASSRPRTGGGAGGSRSTDWTPRPEPEPSAREVEAFQERLEQQMASRVDPAEDPCDQFLDVMRSTVEAGQRPGQGNPELPSRAAMRENCRSMPAAYRQCLSPEYFREHLDECNEQMARMARRGERRAEEARRRFDDVQSGREPWPGQETDRPAPPGTIEPDAQDEGG